MIQALHIYFMSNHSIWYIALYQSCQSVRLLNHAMLYVKTTFSIDSIHVIKSTSWAMEDLHKRAETILVSPPDHKGLVTSNTNSWQWCKKLRNSSVTIQIWQCLWRQVFLGFHATKTCFVSIVIYFTGRSSSTLFSYVIINPKPWFILVWPSHQK